MGKKGEKNKDFFIEFKGKKSSSIWKKRKKPNNKDREGDRFWEKKRLEEKDKNIF